MAKCMIFTFSMKMILWLVEDFKINFKKVKVLLLTVDLKRKKKRILSILIICKHFQLQPQIAELSLILLITLWKKKKKLTAKRSINISSDDTYFKAHLLNHPYLTL